MELDIEQELGFLESDLSRSFKTMEQALDVAVSFRGNKVILRGDEANVRRAVNLINELRDLRRKGHSLSPDDIRYVVGMMAQGEDVSVKRLVESNIAVSTKRRHIVPKTKMQAEYVKAMRTHDMVFGIGPAGTGKTYLAMAMAVNALLGKTVNRIVLARPAVEAGEKLGFLPGDIYEKVNPYLRPLYDALYDMMELEKANRLIERGVIEIAPLAFMRGRTLNDSFIILDEAQNTTSEQMKMYLTRLGYNSKTVITGDITQIDLPPGKVSGLVEAKNVLGAVEGIKVVYFSGKDVVRHRLVQEIVEAYDRFEKRHKEEDGEQGGSDGRAPGEEI
ncbi:MAG: PhoH family protein [Nitrospirota bacterium]